jgi:hypothetical protein
MPSLPRVLAVAIASLVVPASGMGAITGTVFDDRNSNGVQDPAGFVSGGGIATSAEPGVAGVVVKAFGSDGAAAGTATTDGNGEYVLNTAATGTVRVEFAIPAAMQSSFRSSAVGVASETSVQFVGDGESGVDFGVITPSTYCTFAPSLLTCLQPSPGSMQAATVPPGPMVVNAAGQSPLEITRNGESISTPLRSMFGGTTLATQEKLGCVYGIGVDPAGENAYFGTYVKRHCPYPEVDGAIITKSTIFRLHLATQAVTPFHQFTASPDLPAHDIAKGATPYDYGQDGTRSSAAGIAGTDVYHQVGRAGLGDVDVTRDGSALIAVEMTESAPKYWRIPLIGTGDAVTPGVPTSINLAKPATFDGVVCTGTWHPMGLGQRDMPAPTSDRILVGGVCGGDESKFVADPASSTSRTQAAAFVLELNAAGTAFSTIAAMPLDYAKASAVNARNLTAWNATTTASSGLWHNWHDGAPPATAYAWPKPMLANIEIMDNGDLVLSMRDRYQDQVKSAAGNYETGTSLVNSNNTGGAEVVRLCYTDGATPAYVKETNGACGALTGGGLAGVLSGTGSAERGDSPLFYNTSFRLNHPYTSIGGAASLPGTPYLWIAAYDQQGFDQQGVKGLGPCAERSADNGSCGPTTGAAPGTLDGAYIGGTVLSTADDGIDPAAAFSYAKGNGLADLEVLCSAAPVQIGNRVWIDANKNGLQDADEAPVAGVTVRLYDASNTLVGTATTDASGTYYFVSTRPASTLRNSSNVGGGLVPGQPFTVRLDNPANYTGTGPLAPYALTVADMATAPAGADASVINSKATLVDGYPRISVAPLASGENNHTFDAGFNIGGGGGGGDEGGGSGGGGTDAATMPVGMGDYAWIDTNRNGIQDPGERPLAGVKVELLNPDGSPATDFTGAPVAPAYTDFTGRYLIVNLKPGSYMARFTVPTGYTFTQAGAGVPGTDSNPNSIKGFVGTTPVFSIAGSATGNTTAYAGNAKAVFANLTIDAGVVPLVAIGDYVWYDTKKDGIQGRTERPVRGAKVYLLNPDGSRARNATGTVLPVLSTNARGRYLFDGLLPGRYKVKFVYPRGYAGTLAGRGRAGNNSNPKSTPLNRRVAFTPVFTVFDQRKGNTVPQSNPRVNARYIDRTIDAGIVRDVNAPQVVTG